MANFTDTVDWLTKNANDIATRISGSQWAKDVLPGFQQLQQEAGEAIASNLNANVRINGVVRGAMDVGGIMGRTLANVRGEDASILSGKIADRIKQSASDTSADDIIDVLFREYQDDYQKVFANDPDIDGRIQQAKSIMKESFKDRLSAPDAQEKVTVTAKEAYDDLTPLQKGKALGKTYFDPTSKDAKFNRIATAIGVHMGASAVNRVMNGGTLTQDSYGRKNLVGIPFI